MKLQSLLVTYGIAKAEKVAGEYGDINPYVFSEFDFGDYPDITPEITPRGNRDVEAITVDMNWRSYDDRSQMMFETLFPGTLNQTEFQENEEMIRNQDEEICRLGYDPQFPDIRVKCDKTRSTPRPKIKYMTPARKFKQLKLVVLWLQKSDEFGRYCYYGCHCLPEGSHNLLGNGYGVPVDPIDRSCKNFFQCYDCAKIEDPTCQGDKVKYKYRLLQHKLTGKKSIECVNKEGTCQRNICECDKRWSEKLANFEDDFNPKFHKNRGADFDPRWIYNNECIRSPGKFGKPDECCGDSYPDKMPLQKGKKCCGYRPFDPKGSKKCCNNEKLRDTCDA